MTAAQSFEVDNILNLNNNNKIATKQHQAHINGDKSDNMSPKSMDEHRNSITPTKSDTSKEMHSQMASTDSRTSFTSMTAPEQTTVPINKAKGEGSRVAKYATTKLNRAASQTANANNSVEGSYHCQFCDKSFPRLGYLKKHEQVS